MTIINDGDKLARGSKIPLARRMAELAKTIDASKCLELGVQILEFR